MDQIITILGGASLLIGAVAWLMRSIINHFLSKDIENYKIRLKAETDQKIEEFRTSLRMSAFEHEIRFLHLHEKRAEILAELYKRLVDAVSAARIFVAPVNLDLDEEGDKNRHKEAIEKSTSFYNYFDIHRIFLSDELCLKIEGLTNHIRIPIIEHAFFLEHPDFELKLGSDKIDIWSKAWNAITEKGVPEARKALENEFRKLLGV